MNNTFLPVHPASSFPNGLRNGGIKTATLLVTLLTFGCSTVEPPFLNPPLDKAAKESRAQAGLLMQEPNNAQKSTSFYQTPKPPLATRNASGGTPPPAPSAKAGEGAVASLNLDSMPLPQFVTAVFSAILKRNVSMDPVVAQRTDMVSLRTGKPQTEAQIFAAAQAVLRSYGLAVSDFNGLVRVVPESAQTGYMPEIRRGRAQPDVPEGLRPIFYFVELESISAAQVSGMLRTLFPSRLTVTDDGPRNSIMLSGQTDTVMSALEAVQLLDQPLMRGRLSVRVTPVFWSADEMAKRLVEMLNAEGYAAATNATATAPILVLPIAPVNSVAVFSASQDVLNHVLRWAQELDQSPPGRGSGYINYYVRNTDAAELASTLKEVLGEAMSATTPVPSTGTLGTAAAASPLVASRSGSKVVVNKASNSLIIKVTPAEYQQWYGLIQELDRPSRTALIMATVAEIRLTDSETFGFNWMLKQFQSNGYNVNTGTSSAPGTTANVAAGTFRVALATLTGDPRALLTALANSNKIRVLSNPSVMTRSGEQATIQVGQEVPIVTSQQSDANTGTSNGSTGILQTIQYRSTGVILKVKPVVRSGGRIDVDVSQEVSLAQSNTTGVNTTPIILTRKVDTKLSVTDGNTILLGGLISEQSTNGNAGIPYLKDIPYVGALFRTSMTETKERTELVVLLTPYVVEDDFDARAVTDAFRNQFSWAKEIKAPAIAKSATVAPTSVVVPPASTIDSPVIDKAIEQLPSPKAADMPAVEPPAAFRSKPYELPAKETPPPSPVSSVAPVQQTSTAIQALSTPIATNPEAVVINSKPVPVVPNSVAGARPVTDEALKQELLKTISGADSSGAKP